MLQFLIMSHAMYFETPQSAVTFAYHSLLHLFDSQTSELVN